jgi:uncharacterized protein (TIGR02996 family)
MVKKGKAQTPAPPPPAPPPPDEMALSFEVAILENPDDDGPYLVYADYLMAKGDPRGELIVMQHDADEAEGARKRKLQQAATTQFDAHKAQFLGPLANIEHGSYKAIWRYGFLRKLELQWDSHYANHDAAFETLSAVLQHPSTQFVLDLQIGCIYDDYYEPDFQGVLDVLADLKKPATVRTLDLGITSRLHKKMTTDFGELSHVIAALPKLRRIRLRERNYAAPRADDPVHEMTIKRGR